MADGDGVGKKCPTPCKKGEGNVRTGEMSGGNMSEGANVRREMSGSQRHHHHGLRTSIGASFSLLRLRRSAVSVRCSAAVMQPVGDLLDALCTNTSIAFCRTLNLL